MDQIVVDLGLSVHERWELHKNHIAPLPGNDGGKRLCVVTGIHGDELEGQYVAVPFKSGAAAAPRIPARHRRYLPGHESAGHQHDPARRAAVRSGHEPHVPRLYAGRDDPAHCGGAF